MRVIFRKRPIASAVGAGIWRSEAGATPALCLGIRSAARPVAISAASARR